MILLKIVGTMGYWFRWNPKQNFLNNHFQFSGKGASGRLLGFKAGPGELTLVPAGPAIPWSPGIP